MQDFVDRKIKQSPSQAATDPQVEMMTEMSRQADLDSRLARMKQDNKSSNSPDGGGPGGTINEPDGTPPAQFKPSQTEHADPVEPEESETPRAVAGDLLEEKGSLATPVPPAGSVSPDAQPAPIFTERTATPTPAKPVESKAPDADPEEPEINYTKQAIPSQVFQDLSTPDASINFNGEQTTATMIPDALPFDFDRMMELAHNQVELPTIRSTAYEAGNPDLLAGLPDFPDISTQPSTDFANAKLANLSMIWKQWERDI